jgi:hypothetical protein
MWVYLKTRKHIVNFVELQKDTLGPTNPVLNIEVAWISGKSEWRMDMFNLR